MAVRDSDDIYFMEVYTELTGSLGKGMIDARLRTLLHFAIDDYFDPKYKGNKDTIKCFRNYGKHNSRLGKIENIINIINKK